LVLALLFVDDLSSIGVAGGSVTGPALRAFLAGAAFVACAAFLHPVARKRLPWRLLRMLAIGTGWVLCAPLFIYYVSPVLFRTIFPGLYDVEDRRMFVMHFPAFVALASLVATTFLVARGPRTVPADLAAVEFE
jgi:hypothetical protein